ncbi:MAG: PilZ domain-containing protein [Rhizobiaceae bacterium]|nr:PilZ domain-containing protein [Rhizobiaceae bacterium]
MPAFSAVQPPSRIELGNNSAQRVTVNLNGRLMLTSSQAEYECKALDMSPADVAFQCTAYPTLNERIVAYVDHIGRLECTVVGHVDHGFIGRLHVTERKREKLAAQLAWLANKHKFNLPEDRRHDRIMPHNTRSEISLDDGRAYPCRIIDLSMSGAAVEIDVRPALGTAVRLGNMRGRVVRHFQEGVAIEFANVLSREGLQLLM